MLQSLTMTTNWELKQTIQQLKDEMDEHPKQLKMLHRQKLQAKDDLSQIDAMVQTTKINLKTLEDQMSIIKNVTDSYSIASKPKVKNLHQLNDALTKARE